MIDEKLFDFGQIGRNIEEFTKENFIKEKFDKESMQTISVKTYSEGYDIGENN